MSDTANVMKGSRSGVQKLIKPHTKPSISKRTLRLMTRIRTLPIIIIIIVNFELKMGCGL